MDPRVSVFLAVARLGHLTQASQLLNMSPSSVSAQIAALERDLGAPLFVRGSRGMKLTPSGHALFTTAEQMEAVWTKAVRTIRAEHEGAARVGIAASQTAAELFLGAPLGRFRALWPDTRIHLVMSNSYTVIDRVSDGSVDIGIVEGGVWHHRFHHEKLWTDELTLIVSSYHVWASRQTVSVAELTQVDWILREEGSGTRRVFEQALERSGHSIHELNIIMELSSLRSIVSMVVHNVGVSVVSRTLFEAEEMAITGLVPIVIEGLDLRRTLEAAWVRSSHSNRTEQLLEQLRQDVRIRQRRSGAAP